MRGRHPHRNSTGIGRSAGVFLPRRCAVCRLPGPELCEECSAELSRHPGGWVRPPPGIDSLYTLWRYDGAVRTLVASFKFRSHRDALGALGSLLAEGVASACPRPVVTWVPAAPAHLATRGGDQGRDLARRLGAAGGWPVRSLLRRSAGRVQTGAPADVRRLGPSLTGRGPCPGEVILVDDVVTTGASLEAAARVLRGRGAQVVVAAVVAVAGRRESVGGGRRFGGGSPAPPER